VPNLPARPTGSRRLEGIVDRASPYAYNVSMGRDGLLGSFEQMVLLAILQVGESAYAPLVLEKLEEGLGRKVSRGSIYVTLDRLESKGLLRSTAGEPEGERGGRPKRYLAVTEQGIAALRQARESLMNFWTGLDRVLEK